MAALVSPSSLHSKFVLASQPFFMNDNTDDQRISSVSVKEKAQQISMLSQESKVALGTFLG